MKKITLILSTLLLTFSYLTTYAESNSNAETAIKSKQKISDSTADHTQFKILQKEFTSGPEVTEACLSCHTKAAHQVKQSLHWTWDYAHPKTGQKLGKRNVFNSFCGNVASNEARCTSCHIGYGWKDMQQAPPAADNKVDCVVCHDTTGTYSKWPTGAGHPLYETITQNAKTYEATNLSEVAKNVGMPKRENCGACHFYGGGGDNVKHGDLSSALYNPERKTDVHMASDGLDFACSTCHVSNQHMIDGSRYAVNTSDTGKLKPGQRRDVATCESCHTNKPHPNDSILSVKLNNHTEKIACQTCHIPEFAKGGIATKTSWRWSEAGKLKDGKPYSEDNYTQGDGKKLHTYLSTKGTFSYGENVVPYYAWFNGQVKYNLQEEVIDPSKIVEINKLGGSGINGTAIDKDSRIWPFKRMDGSQAYDKVSNKLVATNVWGPNTDTAFWTNFNWDKSITAGMKAIGAEYSGEYGFVDTYMYWPITHMVSPKEDALNCADCHQESGRLAGIKNVYIPGQSKNIWLDRLGFLAILLTLLGVITHAFMRKVLNKGGK